MIYLFIHNKIFFLNATIDSNLFIDEIKFQHIPEKHCDDCNTVNDLKSIFCSNCGGKLH